MIKTANIIEDDTKEDEVGLGKRVEVYFIDEDESESYDIVTTMATDVLNNKISIESPLGKAIFYKKVGEVVEVESPDGSYSVRIDRIEKAENK